MRMNYFQKKENEELGERIRLARLKKGLTQPQLSGAIIRYYMDSYETYLNTKKLSQEEIDSYFDYPYATLNDSLKKKLKSVGIDKSLFAIASSTISHYENGSWEIPAWYVELMKKILGDF